MPLTSALPIAALLGTAVLVYAGLYWLVAALVRASATGKQLRQALGPVTLGAAIFSLLIVLYAAISAPLRYEPGTEAYRDGPSWEVYLTAARAGLILTYLLAVVVSAAIGAALAPRNERAVPAALTVTGVVLFMVLTAPITEALSECYANVTLVLRPSC